MDLNHSEIRTRFEAAKMTQQQVADAAQLSLRTVSILLNPSSLCDPKLSTLNKLAAALNCSAFDLVRPC